MDLQNFVQNNYTTMCNDKAYIIFTERLAQLNISMYIMFIISIFLDEQPIFDCSPFLSVFLFVDCVCYLL